LLIIAPFGASWFSGPYVSGVRSFKTASGRVCFETASIEQKHIETGQACLKRALEAERRKKGVSIRRSVEGEYRVEGNMLDELGLDRQTALELKLKAALHQKILQFVRRRGCSARDLERVLQIQQPRVSELMRGKLSTSSVARLLLYADLLGAQAEVKLRKSRAHAAA
jgi:predicted XRE-type DNA-binding protein